jgi:tetratricopeptide (TPR) repeat protein
MEATQRCTAREAARILQISESQVLHVARLGGIAPEPGAGGDAGFTFQQLLLLRTTQGLLDAGVPARRVRRVWASLRRQLRSDLPLTRIRILADGDRAIAWDGAARWQPESGQFLLDFEASGMAGVVTAGAPSPAVRGRPAGPALALLDASPADPPASDTEPGRLTAEQWFHIASELEAESPLEARAAYRQALELDPDMADAHLNLGRLEHEAGELGKAEAHYRDAVRCAPDDAVSHFNLGVLLEDRRRPDEAILAYRQAIARDPEAADAHYNLGLLLESRGLRAEAIGHLMTARRLYAETGVTG